MNDTADKDAPLSISRRQMAIWNRSCVQAYNKDGELEWYGLPPHWALVAFDLGCVYYTGPSRDGSACGDFRIGDNACTFRVHSRSLARTLRTQARKWKQRHSGQAFHARLVAAAEEVRKDFIPDDALLYGSNGLGEFYMHDARHGRDQLVFILDERGYLHSADGTQLKA